MTDQVITDPQQVSAAWLTEVLGRSGALRAGRVRDVTREAANSINAQIVNIKPHYDDQAAGALPQALLLKICAGGDSFGPSEVHYYTRDYTGLAGAPIPRCYDAQFSAERQAYHILMDDLSATHHATWDATPTLAYGCAVAEALAALHAHWWEPERLSMIGAAIPGEHEIGAYIGHIRPGLEPLIETLEDTPDPAWRHALVEIFVRHPAKMLERTHDGTGFTLIHGDVNPGNVLAPISGAGPVYLIDRQPFDWSLTTWLGVSDIAYMIIHRWGNELRQELELPILRHYHAALEQRGVAGYAWEQLLRDYRLAAVQSVYVATEWCVAEEERTKMRWLWEPQLHKAMTAFFDLGCAELWDG
ncbi:MAG: phosphotransferase [Roseiflexaceae bacterium]